MPAPLSRTLDLLSSNLGVAEGERGLLPSFLRSRRHESRDLLSEPAHALFVHLADDEFGHQIRHGTSEELEARVVDRRLLEGVEVALEPTDLRANDVIRKKGILHPAIAPDSETEIVDDDLVVDSLERDTAAVRPPMRL